MKPRLTIGIPTHGRAERCQSAIASVLWQSLPVNVIVADDSDNDDIEQMMKQFVDNPFVTYRRSLAKTLWQNWKFAAKEAVADGAEFFTWLQDDDLLSPKFARRVVRAFDQFDKAMIYCAHLMIAYNNMLGCSWAGNAGPRLALDFLFQNPITFDGRLLAPMGYIDAWCMSPAKSFRVGPEFLRMLDDLPDHCDALTEVLDIAYMGMYGPAIADPFCAGYWMMHNANQCNRTLDTRKEEIIIGWGYLDSLMDRFPGWRDVLLGWVNFMATEVMLDGYRKTLTYYHGISPYADQINDMFHDIILMWRDKGAKKFAEENGKLIPTEVDERLPL